MPATSGFRPGSANAAGLFGLKLEYVILTLLLHYGGSYEDSFLEWYSAVKLAVPQLSDPQSLRNAFQRLSEQGTIELRRPDFGSYSGEAADVDFFLDSPFIAALAADGIIHWVAVRVALKQSVSDEQAAGPVVVKHR